MKTSITHISILLLLCILSSIESSAQSSTKLLNSGLKAIQDDDLQKANKIYSEVYENDTAAIKIQAIAGLLKVAIYSSEMSTGDSLIMIGDQLSQSEIPSNILATYRLAQGEYYRVASNFSKAIETFKIAESSLRQTHKNELAHADALQYIGLVYEQTSAFDSSLYYINLAKDIYESKIDTSSFKYGQLCNSLGSVHLRLNHFKEAKLLYQKAIRILLATQGRKSSDIAMVMGNLAAIYRAEGNNQKGIEITKEALKINILNKDRNGQSYNYYSLGVFSLLQGDYGRTKDYMQACIDIRKKLYGDQHSMLIGPYEVAAIGLDEAGQFQESRVYFNKARKVILSNFGHSSVREGYNLENVALSFQNSGELDSALVYLQKSNSIFSAGQAKRTIEMSNHYFSLASIHYMLGHYNKASDFLQHSNQILEHLLSLFAQVTASSCKEKNSRLGHDFTQQ